MIKHGEVNRDFSSYLLHIYILLVRRYMEVHCLCIGQRPIMSKNILASSTSSRLSRDVRCMNRHKPQEIMLRTGNLHGLYDIAHAISRADDFAILKYPV